ncbi:D-serine ammonia-lyase [Acidimangrovimonas sediminis]|uniref:D-serine ammonia-lyase n=1 Tax=Acidimangrovimonas sediminis TaxID=2056283 RepID=UPI000C7FC489|nr:D-serine ammonia-lyase [Acidimangrovimonas sediminis]
MTDLRTRLTRRTPLLWLNPDYRPGDDPEAAADLAAAVADWAEIAPALSALFPELGTAGRIVSDLLAPDLPLTGARPLVKADHALPVAGSVKARGGLFEVVTVALAQARAAGIVPERGAPGGGDTAALTSDAARAFFARRRVLVGSTGNLGLSVGIAARALGYAAVVHMSSDAKPWKVARLRALGVEVVQHRTDYTEAVAAARRVAAEDPLAHFVDDEDSLSLYRGYTAAGAELAAQLQAAGHRIGPDRPLILYLPCGIGGAPGGIAHGARGAFGADVHAFFVEPVEAPSALYRMALGSGADANVRDIGLGGRTEADGMAVNTMSALVAERMRHRLAGVLTVTDDDLFRWLARAHAAGLRVEPSAASGFAGPALLAGSAEGRDFAARHLPGGTPDRALQVVWTTGGAFVPEAEYADFLARGQACLARDHDDTGTTA